MESYFDEVVRHIGAALVAGEEFSCYFSAEQSDFVRFNHARVRQAGSVEQAHIEVRLMRGKRHASAEIALAMAIAKDSEHIKATLADLRSLLALLPEDPLFAQKSANVSSRSVSDVATGSSEAMVDTILTRARGADFVGFLANGPQQRGFADSLGQRNWHEVTSFNLEWSLYHQADKAVKAAYAGVIWDEAVFGERMDRAHHNLSIIQRPARRLAPGGYRVFVAPTALSEVVSMLGWGGFSEKAQRTRQSPLQKLVEGQQHLSPMLTLSENTEEGLAPTFQSEGYMRPAKVDLIRSGQYQKSLVSPPTAREYGIEQNGADTDAEVPQSLDMAGGTLAQKDALARLGTGLYLNNLWYLNFSDRMNCRLTGMTRFASLWVENGEVVAPCDVMRFDDSVYRMLGSNLEALTEEREFLPDSATYSGRMTVSQRLPGALIDDLRLTL
jgi:predicted Zn-dependent protease